VRPGCENGSSFEGLPQRLPIAKWYLQIVDAATAARTMIDVALICTGNWWGCEINGFIPVHIVADRLLVK
jgi:hypothetical protein